MSANGAAVNPLYATKIGVFNGKEKNMHYELCGHAHIK